MRTEGPEDARHCWADYRGSLDLETDAGLAAWYQSWVTGTATCLLAAGHAGPHEWTPDDEIGVTFR